MGIIFAVVLVVSAASMAFPECLFWGEGEIDVALIRCNIFFNPAKAP